MAFAATIPVITKNAWTALNAAAAAGNLSLYHKAGGAVYVLVSTSATPPTYDQASVDLAFRLEPGEEIIGTTCALMAPDLVTPQYVYAAPADGPAAAILARGA